MIKISRLTNWLSQSCIVVLVVVDAVVDYFFFLGFMSKAMVIRRTAGKSRDHF